MIPISYGITKELRKMRFCIKKPVPVKSLVSILLLFMVIPTYAFLSYLLLYGFILPTAVVVQMEEGETFAAKDLQELDEICKENDLHYWVFKDNTVAWFTWWQQKKAYDALQAADWTQDGERGLLGYESDEFWFPRFYRITFDEIPYFFQRRP